MWNTDSSGNFLSQGPVMSGANYALQSLETTFNQDLNSDGTVGPVVTTIEAFGATDLKQVADTYFTYAHGTTSGPQLKMSNAAVTVGQFGAWTPIGAAQTASGGLVVWKNGAADQYLVWKVDGSGNWLSQSAVLSGASTALQVLEPGFNQDLNGVGGITARTVIESAGSTTLARIANTFVVSPTTSALGLQLMMSGAAVTVGQFGNWTPIGAEQAADGTYQVAWKNGVLDQYIGWNFDSSGNYLSQGAVVAGGTWYLEAYESALHQDLNGDSTTGPTTTTIETAGSTTLTKVADSYFFNYASNGPQLTMNGAYVAAGQFANWTPIGVEQGGQGYWLAWKNSATHQYIVWETDGAGNFLRNMIAPASGTTSAAAAVRTLSPPGPERRRGDPDRGLRSDQAGSKRQQLCPRSDGFAGRPAGEIRRCERHRRPVRRVDADRRRADGERLSGRLEERRRRSVSRVEHRQQRQLAFANRRDVGIQPDARSVRKHLPAGPQFERHDRCPHGHGVRWIGCSSRPCQFGNIEFCALYQPHGVRVRDAGRRRDGRCRRPAVVPQPFLASRLTPSRQGTARWRFPTHEFRSETIFL